MNKLLLWAPALVLGAAAFAADAPPDGNAVVISGFADLQFGVIHLGDASNGAKGFTLNRVDSNSSNIRFSGKENLGDGLKAIWQVESGYRADDASSGTFASRNSHVGLTGSFGTVFLGLWDAPYKMSSKGMDPFNADNIAAHTAIISNGTFTGANPAQTAAAQDVSRFTFSRRQANSMQYWSPSFSHFNVKAGYGAGEEKSSSRNPYMLSLSGAYEKAPLYIALGHERHYDYRSAGTSDQASKINLLYSVNGWRAGFIYEWLDYEMTPGKHLRSQAFSLTGSYQFGMHRLKALIGIRGDGKGGVADGTQAKFIVKGPETGGRQFNIGYDLLLSKRTTLYAYYTHIDNQKNALFSFSVNGITNPGAGADLSAFALGMRHLF